MDPDRPDPAAIAYAAAGIRYGRLVAFPTETVYGLAANRDDPAAIGALYRAKGRPRRKPLTVHIADRALIARMGCRLTGPARRLAGQYWPGPLTIILRSRRGGSIGFRMPANAIALALLRKAEVPVVAPSANMSGRPAPTNAAAVLRDLDGRIDMVLDGGRTRVGVESTVVDLSGATPQVLREGAISRREIERSLLKGRAQAT